MQRIGKYFTRYNCARIHFFGQYEVIRRRLFFYRHHSQRGVVLCVGIKISIYITRVGFLQGIGADIKRVRENGAELDMNDFARIKCGKSPLQGSCGQVNRRIHCERFWKNRIRQEVSKIYIQGFIGTEISNLH